MNKADATLTALNAAAEGYATKLTTQVMTTLRERHKGAIPEIFLEGIEATIEQTSDLSFQAGWMHCYQEFARTTRDSA